MAKFDVGNMRVMSFIYKADVVYSKFLEGRKEFYLKGVFWCGIDPIDLAKIRDT